MDSSLNLETLFAVWALTFQVVLIVHFGLWKWHLSTAIRYGPIVYALDVPAAALSVLLLLGDKNWSLWFGGFSITVKGDGTVLEGVVPDQSALFGILAKINDLGLSPISVKKLPREGEDDSGQ